jgi:hypothetical protein
MLTANSQQPNPSQNNLTQLPINKEQPALTH